MKFRLEETLNQAVRAHREGQLQKANDLYEKILQVEPKDPDANHNIGLICLGEDNASKALTFFWTALEANPEEWQYWVSYIDALIISNRMGNAQIMYTAARKAGAEGEVFDRIAERLAKPLERKAS
jgi:tetratricopeptide (TPR) repeat protein